MESDDTDQVVFDVTDTAVDSADADGTDQAEMFTVSDTPGWVTATVCVNCGLPLVVTNVTVALRDAVAGFA